MLLRSCQFHFTGTRGTSDDASVVGPVTVRAAPQFRAQFCRFSAPVSLVVALSSVLAFTGLNPFHLTSYFSRRPQKVSASERLAEVGGLRHGHPFPPRLRDAPGRLPGRTLLMEQGNSHCPGHASLHPTARPGACVAAGPAAAETRASSCESRPESRRKTPRYEGASLRPSTRPGAS